jgi:hypothetical protein
LWDISPFHIKNQGLWVHGKAVPYHDGTYSHCWGEDKTGGLKGFSKKVSSSVKQNYLTYLWFLQWPS